MPSYKLPLKYLLRKEQAVALAPNLREVSNRRIRIRYKPESMLGRSCKRRNRGRCRHSQRKPNGHSLDEGARELRDSVAVCHNASNTIPAKAKRVNGGAYQP